MSALTNLKFNDFYWSSTTFTWSKMTFTSSSSPGSNVLTQTSLVGKNLFMRAIQEESAALWPPRYSPVASKIQIIMFVIGLNQPWSYFFSFNRQWSKQGCANKSKDNWRGHWNLLMFWSVDGCGGDERTFVWTGLYIWATHGTHGDVHAIRWDLLYCGW